jgi:hypothetical protein
MTRDRSSMKGGTGMVGKELVTGGDEFRRGNSTFRGGVAKPVSVKILIALEAILAFFGFASGFQFIRDPSGGTHDMETSILEGTPVGDFLLVGLFFVICYGILPVLIIYGLWRLPRWRWTDAVNRWTGQNWAWTGAATTGVALIVWIIVEIYYIGSPEGFPRFLQVTFAALGAVMLILAFLPRTRAYTKLMASPDGTQESDTVTLRVAASSGASQGSVIEGGACKPRRGT